MTDAQKNFESDVDRIQNVGMDGIEYQGEVYTEWENLPKEVKKIYEEEAEILGEI